VRGDAESFDLAIEPGPSSFDLVILDDSCSVRALRCAAGVGHRAMQLGRHEHHRTFGFDTAQRS
jgi:hypothetical protein